MNALPTVIPIAPEMLKRIVELVQKREEIMGEIQKEVGVAKDAISTYLKIPISDLDTKYQLTDLNQGFVLMPRSEPNVGVEENG